MFLSLCEDSSWVALSSFLLPSFIFNDSVISGIQVASARVFCYAEDIYHVNPYNCCVIKATFLNNEHIFRFICARANLKLHITHVAAHSSHERKMSQLSNYIFYVKNWKSYMATYECEVNLEVIMESCESFWKKSVDMRSSSNLAGKIFVFERIQNRKNRKVVMMLVQLIFVRTMSVGGVGWTRHDWEANNKLKCQLKWCHSRLRRRHMIYGGKEDL